MNCPYPKGWATKNRLSFRRKRVGMDPHKKSPYPKRFLATEKHGYPQMTALRETAYCNCLFRRLRRFLTAYCISRELHLEPPMDADKR